MFSLDKVLFEVLESFELNLLECSLLQCGAFGHSLLGEASHFEMHRADVFQHVRSFGTVIVTLTSVGPAAASSTENHSGTPHSAGMAQSSDAKRSLHRRRRADP